VTPPRLTPGLTGRALAALLALAACAEPSPPGPAPALPPPEESTVRLMSLNLRNSAARDGEHAWVHRRAAALDRIRAFGPDLLAVQEVMADQEADLRAGLPEYGWSGVGRDDGRAAGERAGLMWRRPRFQRLEEGHFWLSETPDRPSVGWDARLPRIASWVRLGDRAHPERPLLVASTHLSHVGVRAREESARLLRDRLGALAGDGPAVLMGDFNTAPGTGPHATLTATAGAPFVDSFVVTRHHLARDESTGHGFGTWGDGARIDWILVSPGLEVLSADVDTTRPDGRYPSDHWPVRATVRR
jgi:endonuclease/exonuclease/phosphatase family metal-dependent hydrolase